ncbi:MAG: hypothetical protein KAT61_04720 [Gammaproteobacteria bacterium]|nr:hypothetical protein [Gammaproteobacteria bacterium]
MQPRTLVLIITILPLLASNAVYLLSAYEGFVPWCIPYIEGCTTISRAARSGNSIFIYRASMIAYGVLLIWFWIYAHQWLNLLYGQATKISRLILWLGVVAAIFLIVYIDFLGTTGEVNRFMRRHGIMIFFTFTPLAQLLLLERHYSILPSMPGSTIKPRVLQYQLFILLLMLIIGIISSILDITQNKTDISENIVEWNFSLLMNLYFLGMVFIWKDYRYYLKNDSSRK